MFSAAKREAQFGGDGGRGEAGFNSLAVVQSRSKAQTHPRSVSEATSDAGNPSK